MLVTRGAPGDPGSADAFGGEAATDLEAWREIGHDISPIYHVHRDQPPVLVFHGDADAFTPLEQSIWFRERTMEVGAKVEVVVRKGKGHGWLTMPLDIRRIAKWYDKVL